MNAFACNNKVSVWGEGEYFYLNIYHLYFCGTTLVLIFVLGTAHCVTIIMICVTEKSEMVMPWIPSNADSWNGSYFNFLHGMKIIYFDMCKWGFMHYKKKSAWIWVWCTTIVILLKFTSNNCSEARCLMKGVWGFVLFCLGVSLLVWLFSTSAFRKGNLSGWISASPLFIQHVKGFNVNVVSE